MNKFTSQQGDAILWKQMDACVIAGPGSGKTTVLVERYRTLVEQEKFDPHSILAITFTEKAAANMKRRLIDEFAHDLVRQRDIETAWVSTIHGFCARLLREHAVAAGLDPRFTVLDARESDELQFDCINTALDELTAQRRPEALALIEALQTPYIAFTLKDVYDAIRSAGRTIEEVRAVPSPSAPVEPREIALRILESTESWTGNLTPTRREHREELRQWARELAGEIPTGISGFLALAEDRINLGKVPPDAKPALHAVRESLEAMISFYIDRLTAHHRTVVFDVLNRFDELYRQRKLDEGSLDFNDLERRSIEVLERDPETRDAVRRQFRQVMLDEFQDINEQQARLIELVRGEDVFFAVGDPNQSIYAFRHARPEIFHQYREAITAAGKHSVELLHNFRSREEILRAVESLLNTADGIMARELVAGKSFEPKPHPSVEVLKAIGENKDEASAREARWIAHRILQLHRAHTFSDFAVLCRNSESMGPILEAFENAGIPYVCGRRQSYLLSREGLDITALLRVLANPRDGIALATVLRSSLVGISDESLLRLRLGAGSLTRGLHLIAHHPDRLADFPPEDAAKLEAFARNILIWRAQQPVTSLEVLLSRILASTPRTGNIESFLRLARTRGEGRDLNVFLREIERLEAAVSTESELADADQGDCVQVMTAHAAKGLEFPVTIIAGMEKGTRRESAPITFTPYIGLGIKWSNPHDKDGVSDSWQRANREEVRRREKEESNRLLYVAMTRAEDHLILSFAATTSRKPEYWARLIDDFFHPAPFTEDPPPLPRYEAAAEGGEPLLISPPAITNQHDTTVNVTSLAVFAQCPRKYYLERYIGWNLPRPGSSSETPAAELGSQVHDLLARKPGDYTEEAHRLAAVFEQSDLGLRAASAPVIHREWDFIFDVDGTLIRGVIDLWFEQDNEIHIVDYKTDAKATPENYAPQLSLYALALERATGRRPAHAWLHFLRLNQLFEIEIDYANVQDLIARLRTAQDQLDFPVHPGPQCQSCSFHHTLCPAE